MFGTYDPKKVLVSFGGVELGGFGEDSIINIEPTGGGITVVTGCHGDKVRAIDPDNGAKVTLTLLQSSASNDYLSAIHLRDKRVGDGVLPLLIKDLSGRTTYFDSAAWINNLPTVKRGKSPNDNEWVIETAGNGELFVGGHD